MVTAVYTAPVPSYFSQPYGSQRTPEDATTGFLELGSLTSLEAHRLHDECGMKVVSHNVLAYQGSADEYHQHWRGRAEKRSVEMPSEALCGFVMDCSE